MNARSTSNAVANAKVFRALSYALVFLMMACGVLTFSVLIRNAAPGWHAGIIAGILLFIVIDRLYTYRQLKSLTPLSSEWAIALGAQWVLIVVMTRLLLSYANGLDSFVADLSLFTRGALGELFTLEFVVTVLFSLLVWYLLGQFLELLDEMGLDQERALREEPVFIQSEAVPAHQRLVNLIFSTGIALVIFTALSRINLQTIASNTEGLPDVEVSRFSGAEAGALLFFVFGLGLLSLSRLMALQTRWNQLRIPVSSHNLARQWGVYSLVFLFIVAVVVSLLPAGDSLGFFSVLGTLLNFLFSVLFFIGQLIITLILLLFSLPFFLLGQASPIVNPPPVPPPLPNLPVPPASPTSGSELWALIRSILLWGSLLVLLVFAIRQFVRQHDGIAAALRRSRLTNWLILAWQWLYRNMDKTRLTLSQAIADGWQSIVARLEGTRLSPRANLIRFRSLDPRRQIYFFYLAMIRRGSEQGVTRKPSQTPAEYAATLEAALPTAGEDIDSITEAFVEARYSREKIDSGKAGEVKATWERIRRALQDKVKSERSANESSGRNS